MQIEDLKSHIKSKFSQVKSSWTKTPDGKNDNEFFIVPKGLMPLVNDEITSKGFVTIDKGNWVEDENYLVIKISK